MQQLKPQRSVQLFPLSLSLALFLIEHDLCTTPSWHLPLTRTRRMLTVTSPVVVVTGCGLSLP